MVKNLAHAEWLNAEYDKYPFGEKPTENPTSLAKRCNQDCGTSIPPNKALGIKGNMIEASVVSGYVLRQQCKFFSRV
jgi:hypothetical protein